MRGEGAHEVFVEMQDIETMKEFGLSALLQVSAELLNDRLPEAREAARSIVSSTHAAFCKEAALKEEKEQEEGESAVAAAGKETEQEEEKSAVDAAWESLCALSLSPISALAVAKIVSQGLRSGDMPKACHV
jgi:heparan-alpha-glucosaminide N-acetyltransferase